MIIFEEHPLADYPSRTKINARANVTIAFAADFNSAGEKLTKTSVLNQKNLYIPVDLTKGLLASPDRVNTLVDRLNRLHVNTDLFNYNVISINIAGNGIYSLKSICTQEELDEFIYDFLYKATNHPDLKIKIGTVRSGGQTGADEAGAKAGDRLSLPVTILAPKGYKFRDINGVDISDEVKFKARFLK